MDSNRMKLLLGVVLLCLSVICAVSATALSDDQSTTEEKPPMMVPPMGMPKMNPENMPKEKAHEPSEMELLAAKTYRPSWAPLTIFRTDTKAVSYILPICSSPKASDRARAAFILGQTGDISTVKSLRELLKDQDAEVKLQAAIALGEMGDGSGISQIAKSFDQAQPWVKCYAVHALWNLHTQFARSILLERQKNQPPMVAEIITQAVNTKHTKYPTVKSAASVKKNASIKPDDIWFEANGMLIKESDYWWHKGDYNQIIRCMEAAVFMDPTDVESYSVIAWLQWSMGQDESGIHALDRCVANNAENWEAQYELASYYTRSKRWAQAEDPLKKAIELGGNVLVKKSYAHCLEKLGKLAESREVWEQLHKDYPDDAVINNNLNRVKLLSEGQK